MTKQRLSILIILFCFAFLCANVSIPTEKSFASPAEDSLAQADVTQTLTEQASTPLPILSATPVPTTTIPVFTEDWQIMVHKVNQARQNGELSVDEAARLRFMAIGSPENLPLAYLPNSEERAAILFMTNQRYQDGEGALADRMMAVFYDQELWSSETKAYIESEMLLLPSWTTCMLLKQSTPPHTLIFTTTAIPAAPIIRVLSAFIRLAIMFLTWAIS